MRIADALSAMERLPVRTFSDLGLHGLLVVAPHPDDESLGCGGLIAAARAAGVPVTVLVVSDGSGSHPNSLSHPPERLRGLREREAVEAVAHLGVTEDKVIFLRLPDRFVPFKGEDADRAVEMIVRTAREGTADTLFVTWLHDPHCDHEAAHALALRAARALGTVRLLAYPIWGLARPPEDRIPEDRIAGFRLDIRAHLEAKRRAVAAHSSQVSDLICDDPTGFRLSAQDLARFDGPTEIFLEVPL
ncbi:PIG-L deacetylase family protein [Xanthobacteraceae bacterium A53D]